MHIVDWTTIGFEVASSFLNVARLRTHMRMKWLNLHVLLLKLLVLASILLDEHWLLLLKGHSAEQFVHSRVHLIHVVGYQNVRLPVFRYLWTLT